MPSRVFEMHRRVYRVLLALQPRRFRREYGDQMLQLFTDQLRHSHSRSRVWISAVRDLAVSVSYERLEDSMRSSFFVALGGAALVTLGSVGVVSGRRDGFGMAAVSIGLIVVAVVGTAFALWRIAGQPSAVTTEGGAMTSQPLVGYLRWIAVPIAGLGLVFAFFGLAWLSPVHGGVAAGLVLVSAIIWRAFGGSR